MEIPPVSAVAGLIFLAAAASANAQTFDHFAEGTEIAWASDAFATNLMADGITTFSGSGETIRFELGTFVTGFNPNLVPRNEWSASWVVLQSATYDPIENQVIQTATLESNLAPFTENAQAYIWGYNTKDLNAGAEWIMLGADNWKWPAIDATLPATFSISDANKISEILVGAVNGRVDGVNFHMQLQAIPVPEPAGCLLIAMTGLGVLGWRRR